MVEGREYARQSKMLHATKNIQKNFLKKHFWQQSSPGLLCLPLTRLMVFRHEAITNLAWKVFVLVSIKELQWLCKYAEEKLIVTF